MAFDFWDTFDIIEGVGLCRVMIMKVCCIALFALVVPNCVNSCGYMVMPYQPIKNDIVEIKRLYSKIELCLPPYCFDIDEKRIVPLYERLKLLLSEANPENDAEDCIVRIGMRLIEEVGSSVLLNDKSE
jgi:hypothetical protein